jgi:N-acetylglucosaminyldiphosphoundecaprenol N-acetyl-beta-D-mannosaminyltransferase
MILQETPVKKYPVVGVGLSATSYAEVVQKCSSWIERRRMWSTSGAPVKSAPRARYICVTSVHGVMLARADATVKHVLNRADIATPDGMPLVWALRSFGSANQKRVYGPNLMLAICEDAAKRGYRIFLYGGREEYTPLLRGNLIERFPALRIAGCYSPPFRPLTPIEEEDVQAMIRQSDADLILVGISTPKQDLWMHAHLESFPGVVMIGVGAAFDFHAGRVKQAPGWVQNAGLEWFFRLLMEPSRLWKRYLFVTPWFLPLWAMQKLGLLRSDPDPVSEASA